MLYVEELSDFSSESFRFDSNNHRVNDRSLILMPQQLEHISNQHGLGEPSRRACTALYGRIYI